MKKLILPALLLCLLSSLTASGFDEPEPSPEPTRKPAADAPAKPVIYLYPEETTEVTVELDFNGVLTSTYPAYEDIWPVTAQPDRTPTDSSGREYYSLFWEGERHVPYGQTGGVCVAGKGTRARLEDALRTLGLTDKEARECLMY